jgi:transcriptional regulator with XRE-family HTH domain
MTESMESYMSFRMSGSLLVREVRKRKRLTQTELARRLGTTQSAVARLESGETRPRFDTVVAAVRACGLDLHFALAELDRDHRPLIEDSLSVTLVQRLADLVDRLRAEETLRRARRVI